MMDTQSVAPSGTELAKKTFTPGSSNAPLSAHGKRGAAAGQLECRQSTVSCSFTFEGRNRRGGHSDHQLSKSIPHYGSTASGGEADRNSWLVISSYLDSCAASASPLCNAIRCSVGFGGSCGVCACQQSLGMTDYVALNRSAVEAQPMPHSCGLSLLGEV